MSFGINSYWTKFILSSRETLSESYRQLQDRLITLCIEILGEEIDGPTTGVTTAFKSMFAKVFPKSRRYWLPTGCLVSIIKQNFPFHDLQMTRKCDGY